jgi:endonuclease/exonuclease/phosphatase family metal-dependent hydrolase
VNDYTRTRLLVSLMFVVVGSIPGAAEAGTESPPGIVIDGRFEDWADVPVAHADPGGDDLGGGVDFGVLKVASDAERVFLFFEVGVELNLQHDNGIILHVDADNSPATGFPLRGLGVDFEWWFGDRQGVKWYEATRVIVDQNDVSLRQGPTVSSTAFEISFDRPWLLSGEPILRRRKIALLLRNGHTGMNDTLPDRGEKLVVELTADPAPEPCPANLVRERADDIRIVAYNVLFDGLFDRGGRFIRILRALDPDVICFQEVQSHTDKQTADMVRAAIPDARWYAKGDDTSGVTVSRYPFADSRIIPSERNHLWTLIDLPDRRYPVDLSIVNAHPPCCFREEERQDVLDSIAAWQRDLIEPGEPELEPGTPIVIAGDLNLVGAARQVETLLAGAIVNEDLYGPSRAPDWDGTPLVDSMPYHTTCREAYTWRDEDSWFAPGRLDYVVYSDSVLELGNRFVLWTEDMSAEELRAAGLRADDVRRASDHLPVVADFRVLPREER